MLVAMLAAKLTSNHGFGTEPVSPYNSTVAYSSRRNIPIHTTFYWGHNTEVLFSGWPGGSSAMYALALIFVFTLAFAVEWLYFTEFFKPGGNAVVKGALKTTLHGVRSALSYMVILAVMSFNGGVFIAAVSGHAIGFLVFRTRAILKSDDPDSAKPNDVREIL